MHDKGFMESPRRPDLRVEETLGEVRRSRAWTRAAEVGAVPVLRSVACAFAEDSGVQEPALGALRLALSEAITNGVQHGYREPGASGAVTVAVDVHDDWLRVVVYDEGSGFAPRLDSPGLGVGLPILAEVTDTLEIVRGDPVGTEVRMTFRR
jgi:serine/threonine-protein kinase RsbW